MLCNIIQWLVSLPFQYATTVLYNSDNSGGGDFYTGGEEETEEGKWKGQQARNPTNQISLRTGTLCVHEFQQRTQECSDGAHKERGSTRREYRTTGRYEASGIDVGPA